MILDLISVCACVCTCVYTHMYMRTHSHTYDKTSIQKISFVSYDQFI